MKRILYTCFLLLAAAGLKAAEDPDYKVSSIPAALLKNADVVKRTEEYTIKVEGLKDVYVTQRVAITVMNENGNDFAHIFENYGILRDVRSIKGALYDADGKQIRKLKSAEIKDLSGVENSSLMTDTRYKEHSFYHRIYPYTVEYEIETKDRQTFYLPVWVPQEGYKYAVQSSRLSVTVPENYQLRWRNSGYKGNPAETAGKGEKTYTWQVKDMEALEKEPFSKQWPNRTTAVYLGAGDFQVDSYKGKMASWEDMGTFIYALNKGRDVLPDNVKKTVHELTDKLTDPKEKIAVLYNYLQKNTRYISIQLGIGGWQTFDAAYVASKGYGDCKALSNYMYSLLKEAGIPSCWTLVKAGDFETELIEDFPVPQFNHMILSVPLAKDTVWLECTSQTLPAGYLSGFTADRPVLVVNENGGKLVHTPRYGIEQNLLYRNLKAVITEAGDATLEVHTRLTGIQQDDTHAMIQALSRDKMLKVLRDAISLPSYEIKNFDYKEQPGMLPSIDENLSITVNGYASVTGKRMFVVPNVLARSSQRIDKDTARLSEIFMAYPYRDLDTVNISLPQGYTVETMPEPVSIKSKFGNYTSSVAVKDNQILYIRKMEKNDGIYPASDIKLLKEFFDQVYKADRGRVVLVKK